MGGSSAAIVFLFITIFLVSLALSWSPKSDFVWFIILMLGLAASVSCDLSLSFYFLSFYYSLGSLLKHNIDVFTSFG